MLGPMEAEVSAVLDAVRWCGGALRMRTVNTRHLVC